MGKEKDVNTRRHNLAVADAAAHSLRHRLPFEIFRSLTVHLFLNVSAYEIEMQKRDSLSEKQAHSRVTGENSNSNDPQD